jgi:arylsulfatase A-like enzyme
MNILYIHTHDSGRYLNPGNAPRPLPHIEGLAAEAVTFRNAFSAAPTCSPSRSALLTGTPPHANGLVGLAHRGFGLRDYRRHIRHDFAAAGMETALCGIQHVAGDDRVIGYDRILHDAPGSGAAPLDWDRDNIRRAAAYLREPHERPFFLSVGLFTTHRPFAPPAAERMPRSYPPPPPPIPDTPETRQDMEGFVGGLEEVDEAVGILRRALSDAGLREQTVIILTTDHGPAFPEMKGTLYDGGIGVSLIVRIPQIADDGRVEQALVSQIDLHPTLLELCGLPARSDTTAEGRSLLPLLRGEEDAVREAVFAETTYHAVYEPARAVRSQRYKLIRRYGAQAAPAPANVDDSPAKELLAAAGYFRKPKPREELFDLHLDPWERSNLANSAEYRDVRDSLTATLDTWMAETGDVLHSVPVPRPAGSVLNHPHAWSAEEATEAPSE